MSSQNNDGIEYSIKENDETPKSPENLSKSNGLENLPPKIRSQLPESFGQSINHSDAYIEFLKKHKESKQGVPVFNGHPKDYLDFLAKNK
jgi:hypothetical protein